METVS
jgi:hypothetical protein